MLYFKRLVSPINDILDKDSYTIEELLEEEEIIQEMKSGNDRLLELYAFFCLCCLCIFLMLIQHSVYEEENMAKLVGFIVTPASESESEMRIYRCNTLLVYLRIPNV